MRKWLQELIAAIRRLLTQPLGELNRWQLAARYAIGIARYGVKELQDDRATQMAAALTYRTIFSLVPLFVISVLVINAFGGFETLGGDLQGRVYNYLGLSAIELAETVQPDDPALNKPTAESDNDPANQPEQPDDQDKPAPNQGGNENPDDDASPPANPDDPDDPDAELSEPQPMGPLNEDAQEQQDEQVAKAKVDNLISDLQDRVGSVKFGSIGVVGVALLIWAAVALVIATEGAFNRVYHAPRGRSLHMRISIYWAVLTLGPLLLAGSFYMTNRLIGQAQSIAVLGWVVGLLTPFASLAATWLLLLLLYSLLPNTKVKLRPAMIGSFVGAVLWEASKWGFRLYVSRAVGYSALYGSLGLVPLFLLWLNLTWLIILFGLEISYVVQTVKNTRFLRNKTAEESKSQAVVDDAWVLPVAATIGGAFGEGRGIAFSEIASDLKLPPRAVSEIGQALCNAGLIHKVDQNDEVAEDYTLSRPAESIRLDELLGVGRKASAGPSETSGQLGGDAVQRLHIAEDAAVQGMTLADLLRPPAQDTPAEPNA